MATKEFYLKRLVALPLIIFMLQLLCIFKAIIVTIVEFLTPWSLPRVVRTPEHRFEGLEQIGYAFKPNYVELPIGGKTNLPRIHYLDDGPRNAHETILCLHGEPTWSFLYRNMIPVFVKAGYRVIAPDFIGFGKSDKYTHPDSYSHDLHTQSLRLLLDHLKVERLTLVCQDWGGPVGLTVVKDSPHLFSRLIIMNTILPVGFTKPGMLGAFQYATPFLLWRSIVKFCGTYLPIRHIFNFALKHPTSEILDGYCAPFPSHLYKGGVAKWPRLIPLSTTTPVASELQETRDFLFNQWKKNVLLMFAEEDPITLGELKTFQKLLPNHTLKMISDARHFIQEDKGEELANNIISFIDDKLQ